MAQIASNRTTSSATGCLGAGGPGLVRRAHAVSFLSCSLNPVGAAGLAMRILTPHDMYSKPVGWLLTAGSFFIAMTGFIATERIAYLERQRRPLEIASLLACGAGLARLRARLYPPDVRHVANRRRTRCADFWVSYGFRGTKHLPIPGLFAVANAPGPTGFPASSAMAVNGRRRPSHLLAAMREESPAMRATLLIKIPRRHMAAPPPAQESPGVFDAARGKSLSACPIARRRCLHDDRW